MAFVCVNRNITKLEKFVEKMSGYFAISFHFLYGLFRIPIYIYIYI